MKIIKQLLIAISLIFVLALSSTQTVAAACNQTVLGFPTWYRGLVDSNCEIKKIESASDPNNSNKFTLTNMIITIIINIGDTLIRLVGLASVIFIIVGGFKYVLSAGDANRIATAKKTVGRAVVGLVISLGSIGIINLIFGLFGLSIDNTDIPTGADPVLKAQAKEDIIEVLFSQLFVWLGVAAVVMIVFGGVQYILSSGDSNKVTTAKNTIKYAVIGLVLALLSFAIVKIIAGVV